MITAVVVVDADAADYSTARFGTTTPCCSALRCTGGLSTLSA